MQTPEEFPPTEPAVATLSGKLVVIVMFLFGILIAGGVWGYWYQYLKPFRPIQESLRREYPGSNPRVIGGEFRGQTDLKGQPTVVVVMHLQAPPTDNPEQTEQLIGRIQELVLAQRSLENYRLLRVELPSPELKLDGKPPTYTRDLRKE